MTGILTKVVNLCQDLRLVLEGEYVMRFPLL